MHDATPQLPAPRGPLTRALFGYWRTGLVPPDLPVNPGASLEDEDQQLALFCCYELTYRGFDGLDDSLEWDAFTLDVRRRLEAWFEARLRSDVVLPDAVDPEAAVDELLARPGASVSAHLERAGTIEVLREALILRSPYQAKEADPHTWALPRLSGRVKRTLADVQAGEYGVGYDHSHAELFAMAIDAAGADATYGAHVDSVPGSWLATTNLISFFGLNRRLRGALVGHLALYELDSVVPSTRVVAACERLGVPDEVTRFYRVHVLADAEHERLAREGFLHAYPADEPDQVDALIFGAAAAWHIDQLGAVPTVAAWRSGRSALRSPFTGCGPHRRRLRNPSTSSIAGTAIVKRPVPA